MRVRSAVFVLVLACSAGCTGSVEDVFVGRYQLTQECDGVLGDGTPVHTDPQSVTLNVEKAADGSVYIAGRCTFPLDVISATRAELVPVSCISSLDDGTPFTVDVLSGVLQLDGDRAAYTISSINTTPTDEVHVTCTAEGTRL